jgi:hypothetical protein
MTEAAAEPSKPPRTPRPESSYRSGEFPVVSRPEERAAALARRAAYPYAFPRDHRQLGGKFGVDENKRRLLRYFYFERCLAHGLGSWTLPIPDFEVKIETGRHIFWHMDAAKTFRERLLEQETRKADIDGFRDAEIDRFMDEMLSAANTPELLVGAHQVLGVELANAYRHHIDDTDPITDAPTARQLRRILTDYEPMLEWAEGAIAAYQDGGVEEAPLAVWRWHLKRLLASIGGVTGAESRADEPSPMRIDAKPYERGTVPMRDSRFTTFYHTGDYDTADGEARHPFRSYEQFRMYFMRTQRDEVDAIEAFGTFLWDIRFKDWESEYNLARITWDEARHTEIGHLSLAAAGYEPFELANRMTSSMCRGPMKVEFAMAEINLFGEVSVLKTINRFIEEARGRNDMIVAHIADFIRADERTHVRKGQGILGTMTDLGMQELEDRTRELFTECLVALGAIKNEYEGYKLTREELERLIGE